MIGCTRYNALPTYIYIISLIVIKLFIYYIFVLYKKKFIVK